ncbi:Nn.00g066820.m01.CDS01 [Neocucurbitaria sp. VM-36]
MQYERKRDGDNFAILTHLDMVQTTKPCTTEKRQRIREARPRIKRQCDPKHSVTLECTEASSTTENSRQNINTVRFNQEVAKSKPVRLDLSHPYTSYVSGRVQLPEDIIDLLFKSRSFQVVTEPLFCASHVDNDINIVAVFPGCFENTAFVYALLYSIMLGLEDPLPSRTTLRLKSLAIKHLHRDLQCLDQASLDLVIGTVLILSGTAYRSNLLLEHEAHSAGLVKLVEHGKTQGQQLRCATKRVTFWQDLIGAACIGSPRRFSHLTFPEIASDVETLPTQMSKLPDGFAAHKDMLVDDLQDCIKWVISLQELYESKDPKTCNFTLLDKWQASIESRLVFLTDACIRSGPISECCRLAAYICCYTIYTEVWRNSFIPLKQAERLLKHLSDTMNSSLWTLRRDIYLWLVFVCTSTIQRAEMYHQPIMDPYQAMMRQLSVSVKDWDSGERFLNRALEHFIYVDDWLQRRFQNREWLAMEVGLRSTTQQSQQC